MEHEQWKPIPNFPQYAVSSEGRIKKGEYLLKATPCVSHGRLQLKLRTEDGQTKNAMLARLVHEAFVGPLEDYCVAHKDRNLTNCRANNLIKGRRIGHKTQGRITYTSSPPSSIWLSLWKDLAPNITHLLTHPLTPPSRTEAILTLCESEEYGVREAIALTATPASSLESSIPHLL